MEFTGDPVVDYWPLTDEVAKAARPLLPKRYLEAGIDRAIAMRVAIRLARKYEIKNNPDQTMQNWQWLVGVMTSEPDTFEMEVICVLNDI